MRIAGADPSSADDAFDEHPANAPTSANAHTATNIDTSFFLMAAAETAAGVDGGDHRAPAVGYFNGTSQVITVVRHFSLKALFSLISLKSFQQK